MASGGLRATSLSTVTKFDAGKNASNQYFPRHLLYCVLATDVIPPLSIDCQANI
jgi:hypothetical protein